MTSSWLIPTAVIRAISFVCVKATKMFLHDGEARYILIPKEINAQETVLTMKNGQYRRRPPACCCSAKALGVKKPTRLFPMMTTMIKIMPSFAHCLQLGHLAVSLSFVLTRPVLWPSMKCRSLRLSPLTHTFVSMWTPKIDHQQFRSRRFVYGKRRRRRIDDDFSNTTRRVPWIEKGQGGNDEWRRKRKVGKFKESLKEVIWKHKNKKAWKGWWWKEARRHEPDPMISAETMLMEPSEDVASHRCRLCSSISYTFYNDWCLAETWPTRADRSIMVSSLTT